MFMILNHKTLAAVHTHTHTSDIINYILKYINMLKGLGNRGRLLLGLFVLISIKKSAKYKEITKIKIRKIGEKMNE